MVHELWYGAFQTHINQILVKIVRDAPYVLELPSLAAECAILLKYLTKLKSVPTDEIPYVRLSRPRKDWDGASTKKIPMLSRIAFELAKPKQGTLSNYAQIAISEEMAEAVTRIVNLVKVIKGKLDSRTSESILKDLGGDIWGIRAMERMYGPEEDESDEERTPPAVHQDT
ncbi:hypothetical protein L798_07933 [Zootermopsis nevadensis]|uniref:Uncharacterized protein n=1 Tax=Zootermopsis nevadensis TaxID=136037 RepID=A0A067RVU3_ZOONE|nr:hypothetical protein L798_07933 [Zootermopsis nevadensis]